MTSRAQTTSEFIIILAVLLIGLSILAVNLLEFPTFGTAQEKRVTETFWENADIGIINAYQNSTNTTITLKNNLAQEIIIQEVNVGNILITLSTTLQPGETTDITFVNPNNPPTVQIEYKNTKNSQVYTLQGPKISIELI